MKMGGEPKKVAILVGLLVVAAYLYISNRAPSGPPQETPRPAAATPVTATQPQPSARVVRQPELARPTAQDAAGPRSRMALRSQIRGSGRRTLEEFKPSLKAAAESMPDPSAIDPTLRLDLLAKAQSVKMDGGTRNLFQFGAQELPKPLEEKIIPKVAKNGRPKYGPPAPPPDPPEPVKPPPPPIPLKFYGFSASPRQGPKRAFFLDGDEIVVAAEGETIKKRYRVVRIGVNSVVVEDTQYSNQQTLRIVQELTG